MIIARGFDLCHILHSGAEAIVKQAREWETSGEHQRAVECYMKVTPDMVADVRIVEKCLSKVSIKPAC